MIAALLSRHWQTLGIIALALLAWHFHGRATANAEAMREQAASFRAAQAEANRRAVEQKRRIEAQYQDLAERAERDHNAEIADARAAAARYIAANRVRAETAQGDGGRSAASADSDAAGVRAGLPTAGVVVSEGDVQACTDATAYALALREWVLTFSSGVASH